MSRAKAPRVLIVTPQPFYEDRGTPISIRLVASALGELGFHVDILAFPIGRSVHIPGARIHRIANPLRILDVPIGFSWRKLAFDLVLTAALYRRLNRDEPYDVIHAVEEAAYLCRLTNLRRTPVVYDMASSIPEQLAKRRLFAGTLQQSLLRALERAAIRNAAFVLCSSGLESVPQAYGAHRRVEAWRYPPSSPPSSAEDAAALRHDLWIPETAQVVLYTGSFAGYQGVDVLIEAIPLVQRILPEVHYVLVGGTPEEVAIHRERLPPAAAAHVRLIERQPNHRIGTFLACADVLVSPRRYGSNLPLKVYDYLSTGKPMLVSDGPAHEAVRHHPQVRTFHHGPEPLAAALVQALLENDATVPSWANGWPAESNPWDAFKAQLQRVYASVLKV